MEEMLEVSKKGLREYTAHAERIVKHLVEVNETFIETMRKEAEADRRAAAEAHEKYFKILESSLSLLEDIAENFSFNHASYPKKKKSPQKT